MNHLYQHIENFLANTFANVYWKDIEGKYLGINDAFIRTSGVHSHKNIIGKTDKDQRWHEYATFMMDNDREVIASERVKVIIEQAVVYPQNKITHFLSYKSPLRNKTSKIIGTFGLSYPIEMQTWNEDMLNEVAMVVGMRGVEYIKQFLLIQQQSKHKLSKQQTLCLYYLTKGMTIKQIARALSLSHRTVEHYIETVKSKLGCTSKTELFAKAFEIGF